MSGEIKKSKEKRVKANVELGTNENESHAELTSVQTLCGRIRADRVHANRGQKRGSTGKESEQSEERTLENSHDKIEQFKFDERDTSDNRNVSEQLFATLSLVRASLSQKLNFPSEPTVANRQKWTGWKEISFT